MGPPSVGLCLCVQPLQRSTTAVQEKDKQKGEAFNGCGLVVLGAPAGTQGRPAAGGVLSEQL